MTAQDIIKDIKAGKVAPIYLLMGEEPYFIDEIADFLEKTVVPEDMKGFNEHIMYGLDSDVQNIMSIAKGFPMMGDKQLVLVKETQQLKNLQDLVSYASNPQPSTILVLCHKYKKVDKRSALYKSIAKDGCVFLSETVRDYQIPKWIQGKAKSLKLSVADDVAHMLGEYLGTDLGRISTELEKLKLVVKDPNISHDVVKKHVGVTKEYNIFELQQAVLSRDFAKSLIIADYYSKNPKAGHIVPTISAVYNVHSRLIQLYYSKDKSPVGAAQFGISKFMHRKYLDGLQKYSLKKLVHNMSLLKDYDLRAKGLGSSGQDDGLMIEMMQKLVL